MQLSVATVRPPQPSTTIPDRALSCYRWGTQPPRSTQDGNSCPSIPSGTLGCSSAFSSPGCDSGCTSAAFFVLRPPAAPSVWTPTSARGSNHGGPAVRPRLHPRRLRTSYVYPWRPRPSAAAPSVGPRLHPWRLASLVRPSAAAPSPVAMSSLGIVLFVFVCGISHPSTATPLCGGGRKKGVE